MNIAVYNFVYICKKMTSRQTVLRFMYPVLMKVGKWFNTNASIEKNTTGVKPLESFYDLKAVTNNGSLIHFKDFKGQNVLLVNTASDCGYTAQYGELEVLYELYKNKLIVIGFPSNSFKEQEKGSDEEIAEFCSITFGIRFLLMKKSVVVKSENQNEVFKWLTDKNKNGWNDKGPDWNFSKYLVNDRGELTHYFGPAVSPLSKMVTKNIK